MDTEFLAAEQVAEFFTSTTIDGLQTCSRQDTVRI